MNPPLSILNVQISMKNLKVTWQTCEVAKTESGYKARVRAMMQQIDENEEFA